MFKLKYYHSIIVNTVASAILFYLWYIGIVQTAINNDALYIMPAILVISVVGFVSLFLNKLKYTEWCIDGTVNLGFMGTLIGVWTAFSTLETSQIGDISSLVTVVGSLISGIGTAIWTTLVGLFFYLWLGVNVAVFQDDES